MVEDWHDKEPDRTHNIWGSICYLNSKLVTTEERISERQSRADVE